MELGAGIAVICAAGIVAAAVAIRMRRAGLAIHNQLAELRDAVQATNNQAGAIRDEVSALRAEHRHEASRADENLSLIRDRVLTIADAAAQIHDAIRINDANIRAFASDNAALAQAAQDSVDLMARRPPAGLPTDTALLDGKSETEILSLAESVAILRPLVPYPKWRTDADLQNPDLAYQLRRWIWEYFQERGREAPILVPWHAGTRIRLYLGADISRQVYIAGCFEPNEFAFLDRILQPGMTFVDAGANDGLYTAFAARRVGSSGAVWAFEPSAREVERLQYNLMLNNAEARIFQVALADAPGRAELAIGEPEHSGHNTLGTFAYSIRMAGKELVEVRTLDDVAGENPPARLDVLKVDVEGAEFRLLSGARSTLRRYRPVVLFEMSEPSLQSQGSSRRQVLDLLRSESYLIYTFEPHTGLPIPAAEDLYTDNMIAFPKEKDIPDAVHWPWPRP